jgi:soluble lytic murein transglycosylase-like protein
MCGVAAAVLQGAGGAAVSVVRTDPRTGRLVRTVVREHPPVPSALTAAPAIVETVDRIARQNQLSPRLVHSVIQVESNYDPNAVSPKGAQGLMQLIPSTARRFGVSNVFDPADNIQGGARYLKYLLGLYKGDEKLALAAYNAGEAAVSRYGGVPPFPETQDYVAKVRRRAAAAASNETGATRAAVQPNDAEAGEPAEVYNPIREVTGANGKVYYTSH